MSKQRITESLIVIMITIAMGLVAGSIIILGGIALLETVLMWGAA
jgi:hypothetical protein